MLLLVLYSRDFDTTVVGPCNTMCKREHMALILLSGSKLEFRVEFPGISLGMSLFQNAGNVKFPSHFVVQGGIG